MTTTNALKFEADHPAVESLENNIDSFRCAYDQLAGELSEQEEELEKITGSLREVEKRILATREALAWNDRQQAAIRDAIEFLTGERPT